MKLSLNVIVLIVWGTIGFSSFVSGNATDNDKEVITYSIIGTIGVELVIAVIAFFVWKKCKAKKQRKSSKENSHLHGQDNGAFLTNADVSAAEEGLGDYANKNEFPKSTKKIHSPSHSSSPNEKSWNSLPKVQFAGLNLARHGSYASLDNNINSQDPEIVSVNLQSQDFIGLGFNISGSMRDGIFVSEVHNRGPAIESGVLKVGDRILNVTISFENMVFEDALTILSYASPYPVNICVQKHKSQVSYKANGFEMQLNHPLYRSQSLDTLTRIMKETLPKRSYSELKSDNKKYSSFVKQPDFIKDLSSSKSRLNTTNDEAKLEIPVSTKFSEVVIHEPPTDISVPLKEGFSLESPSLEKNKDLKESIKLREPYKLHVLEKRNVTETLESTPKPGSDVQFPPFDSDDSISKLDEQMDIHFSNCDKEFEDLKQKAEEDNFKLNLDFNASKKTGSNSPNSETEFENLEKKMEFSPNFSELFDQLTGVMNLSFGDHPDEKTESFGDHPDEKTESFDYHPDEKTESFGDHPDEKTESFGYHPDEKTENEDDILLTKINNDLKKMEDDFLPMTESNITVEKKINVTPVNSFNSFSSDVSAMRMQNVSDWKDSKEYVKPTSTDLLLKNNEMDGLLILPKQVEYEDKMREDCLEKLLPKSSAEEKQDSSSEIKEQHLGEAAFDKRDSAKESVEHLKEANESQLLSLQNCEANIQGSALIYQQPLSGSNPSVENTLYSVEDKVQETIPDILKESSRFNSAFVKPQAELGSVDSLISMTKDDVDSSLLKPGLSLNEITSSPLKPEVTTEDVGSSFLKYRIKTHDVDPSILNPETKTDRIDSSILLPKVNTDYVDPLLKADDTSSSFFKYELNTEEIDSSLLKPTINTDTDPLEYEVKTDDIKVSLLKTNELKTDNTNPSIFKTDLKADDTESTLLKSEINTGKFGLPLLEPAVKTDVLPNEHSELITTDNVFRVERKIMFTEPIKLHITSKKEGKYSTGEKSELEMSKLEAEEEGIDQRRGASSPFEATEELIEQTKSRRLTPYKYHLKAFDLKDISLGDEDSINQRSNNLHNSFLGDNRSEKEEVHEDFVRPVSITRREMSFTQPILKPDALLPKLSNNLHNSVLGHNRSEKEEVHEDFVRPVSITRREMSFTQPILKPDALLPKLSFDFSKDTASKEAEVSQTDSNARVKSSSEESSLESESEEQKSDETTDQNEEKSLYKMALIKRTRTESLTSSSSDCDEDETVSKKGLADSFLTQPLKTESLDKNATVSTRSFESSSDRKYKAHSPSIEIDKLHRNLKDRETTPTPTNDSEKEEAEEEEENQDKKDEAFFEMTEDELSTDTQSLSPKSAVTRAISCDGGFVTSDDSDLSKPRSDSSKPEIQLLGHEDNYMNWSGEGLVMTESFSQLQDSDLVWTGTDRTQDSKGKSDSDSDSNNDAVTQSDMYQPRENLTQLSLSYSSSSISSSETKTNGERGNDSETSLEPMDLKFCPPFSESNHKTDLLFPREEDNKVVCTNYEGHGAFTVTLSAQSDTDA